jgi:hypothetical protein
MGKEEHNGAVFGYGLLLSHLTPEILDEIARIYKQTVSGRDFQDSSLDSRTEILQVRADLSRGNATEWRFGSKLTYNSKLTIRRDSRIEDDQLVKFTFFPNLDTMEENLFGDEPERLRQEFKSKVSDFLQSQGLAIPLTH